MLKFLNLQPEVFGIDVNDFSLKIIKLKKSLKGFDVVSFNNYPLKPGIVKEGIILDKSALVKAITSACLSVKGQKLQTKYAVVSLPEEKSFSRVIQMPKMAKEDLVSAVPFEAENYIPIAIDKVYLDFQEIESSKHHGGHCDLLINVLPKSIIDPYVYCFKQAGLVPLALEVESQSIARALLKNGSSDSPLIILDLGQDSTGFSIFSGNSIRFTCSLPGFSRQLTQAISDKLGVGFSRAEDLKVKYGLSQKAGNKYNIEKIIQPMLRELIVQIKKYIEFYQSHSSFEYFSSDTKIEKMILCGGGANLKNLPDFLSKNLGMSVEIGNPFINNIYQKKSAVRISNQDALSLATALGLALRGASGEFEI